MEDTMRLELIRSTQGASPFETTAAGTLLEDLEKELHIGRAVVLVRKLDGWVLAGSIRVEYEDFWQDAPISLSVLNDVFAFGKDQVLIDADQRFQDRDSIFLGGMLNIACLGDSEIPSGSKVLLYVDNQIDNWAVQESDLVVMRKLLRRYFPDWTLV